MKEKKKRKKKEKKKRKEKEKKTYFQLPCLKDLASYQKSFFVLHHVPAVLEDSLQE